jgi:predicted DNA-binding protein
MQIVDGAKRGWVVEGVGPCRHLKTVIEKRVEDMEDSIFIQNKNRNKNEKTKQYK